MRRYAVLAMLMALLVAPARAQNGPELVLQAGHLARVSGLAFSRDGRLLASVSDDGTLKIWDVPARSLLHDTRAGQGVLQCVAMSADGRLIATGGTDGTIKLWDANTLALLRTDTLTEGAGVPALCFSADGTMLAAGGWHPEEHVVKVWDVRSGNLLQTLTAPGGAARAVAFAPDGLVLAVGVRGQLEGENEVELWDVRFGTLSRTLKSKRRSAEALAFTPDGRYLAAATIDGTVELWESESTVWLESMPTGGELYSLAISPHGGLIAVGGSNGGAVWSTANRTLQARLQGRLDAVAWSPDATIIAGGGADGTIALFSPTGQVVAAFPARDRWIWKPTFEADGALRLCGHRLGNEAPAAAWWDSRSLGLHVLNPAAGGTVFAGPQGRPTAVTAVTVSSRNRMVATAAANGGVGLWNAADGTLLRTIPALRPQIAMLALDFDPTGARLAGGSADGLISLWDMQGGTLVRQLKGHTAPVFCLAFGREGNVLVSGSQDRTVRLWDTRTGALLLRLDASMAVHSVALSPDLGQIVAAVGEPGHEGAAIVWDLHAGGAPHMLGGLAGVATSVSFSMNGTLVAVGSSDRAVRLFDSRAGTLLRTFEGHNGAVLGVALSPDGSLLASGSADGTVRVWDAREGSPLLTWTTGTVLSAAVRQWIAYDTQGYFLGSDNAASLVRWRIGGEAESAERYGQVYFRPDLLERTLRRSP